MSSDVAGATRVPASMQGNPPPRSSSLPDPLAVPVGPFRPREDRGAVLLLGNELTENDRWVEAKIDTAFDSI
jgi:hypothetical protein